MYMYIHTPTYTNTRTRSHLLKPLFAPHDLIIPPRVRSVRQEAVLGELLEPFMALPVVHSREEHLQRCKGEVSASASSMVVTEGRGVSIGGC